MTFAIGLGIGLLVGGTLGAIAASILLSGKMSDMRERLDAWEATRWPS